jgi:adenylate kinase family enzyme
MRRVMVIGCPGSGKSTFSTDLARLTGLPLISLDAEFWQPGWKPMPREAWRAKVTRLVAADLRLPRADTLIWFRFPRWLCLARVYLRAIGNYGQVRPEMAPGCPERLPERDFLAYIWAFQRSEDAASQSKLSSHRPDLAPVIFRHDAQVHEFLHNSRADMQEKA